MLLLRRYKEKFPERSAAIQTMETQLKEVCTGYLALTSGNPDVIPTIQVLEDLPWYHEDFLTNFYLKSQGVLWAHYQTVLGYQRSGKWTPEIDCLRQSHNAFCLLNKVSRD